MRTITEFNGSTIRSATQARARLQGEGGPPEERGGGPMPNVGQGWMLTRAPTPPGERDRRGGPGGKRPGRPRPGARAGEGPGGRPPTKPGDRPARGPGDRPARGPGDRPARGP